jgi:hypothetical protein
VFIIWVEGVLVLALEPVVVAAVVDVVVVWVRVDSFD